MHLGGQDRTGGCWPQQAVYATRLDAVFGKGFSAARVLVGGSGWGGA